MALLLLAACGSSRDQAEPPTSEQSEALTHPVTSGLAARLDAIDAAVLGWQQATDIDTAHEKAEAVRNLVVGPTGPIYGDADGNGTVAGASEEGLLPGTTGEVALVDGENTPCLLNSMLGGSWSDPGARWAQALAAFDKWNPGDDTIGALPSPAMRLAGWATIGLNAQRIDASRDLAQRAANAAGAVRQAYTDCATQGP